MKLKLKNLRVFFTIIACGAGLLLVGCTSKEHDKILAVGKCMKAANYLDDSSLAAATDYHAKSALKDIPASPQLAMEIGQELRDEAEPYGSSTHIADVLKVALEWKNSSYCKQVESDFADLIEGQVKSNIQVISDTTGDPKSCQKYVAQFDLYSSRHARKYNAQMGQALHSTLKASSGRLKNFQIDAVNKAVGSSEFKELAVQVYRLCQVGGAISEKIFLTDIVQKMQSPTTAELKAALSNTRTPNGDCGEFSEHYCTANLRAMAEQQALQRSISCDHDIAVKDCTATAEFLTKEEFHKLEISELLRMREKYENYLADPEKYNPNTRSNIYSIAQKCKKSAIEKGLRGADYDAYDAATCMPEARKAFLKPQAEMLAKVMARLEN